jgi:hypothetical protein
MATLPENIFGFSIEPSGALTSVPGSPFGTGLFDNLSSLAVFPPKFCQFVQFSIDAGPSPTSINNKGEIARYYLDHFPGTFHGFVRDPGGKITTFDPPLTRRLNECNFG